jgi:imidazolonepropionase-like amidohydrolase
MHARFSARTLACWDSRLLVFFGGCGLTGPAPAATADAIYFDGDIVTMNEAQPSAEALAVKDGKILAVGTREAIEKDHKGATTQMVDLADKTLLPGFVDPHSHFMTRYPWRIA